MKRFSFALTAALIGVLASCKGFKEAMTAHVDVVARAGKEELTVTRLATWLAAAKVPPQKEFARLVARTWVDDQLIALAAAHGDSLNKPAEKDSALWGAVTAARLEKWLMKVSESMVGDSSTYPQTYASGDILMARHILLTPKPGDTTTHAFDSLRKAATALRAKLTPANFAEMAKANSKDPGSARTGGELPPFKKGDMVAPFEEATRNLKPGEISQPVKTQFGYHLIYRLTYAEAKPQFDAYMRRPMVMHADSMYLNKLDSLTNAKVTSSGAITARAVAKDVEGHRNDKSVLATTSIGDFTAAKYARWLSIFPPQMMQQIQSLPDSIVPKVVVYVARNEMMLRQMDSAHITLDSAEKAQLDSTYMSIIAGAWKTLNVDPKALADSGKTETDRQRIAALRVDTIFDQSFSPKPTVRPYELPEQLDQILRDKYTGDISETGLDRAVSMATDMKKKADSSRMASEPPSAIPLPGAGPNAGAPKKP